MTTAILTEKEELLEHLPKEFRANPAKLLPLFTIDLIPTIDAKKTDLKQVTYTITLKSNLHIDNKQIPVQVFVFDDTGAFAARNYMLPISGATKTDTVAMPNLHEVHRRQFFVVADPFNYIWERNETNNFAKITVP